MPLVRVPIEVDVTQVNKTWFTHKKKVDNSKHYVIGFFQRVKERAIIKVLTDNNPETIEQAIFENAAKGCILYAEANVLPESLKEQYEIHELPEGSRVNGDVHINNVNNMWRDLKRQLKRTHVSVSQKHLHGYCNEVTWRINHKHLTPMEKFNLLLSNTEVKDRKTSYKNIIK